MELPKEAVEERGVRRLLSRAALKPSALRELNISIANIGLQEGKRKEQPDVEMHGLLRLAAAGKVWGLDSESVPATSLEPLSEHVADPCLCMDHFHLCQPRKRVNTTAPGMQGTLSAAKKKERERGGIWQRA